MDERNEGMKGAKQEPGARADRQLTQLLVGSFVALKRRFASEWGSEQAFLLQLTTTEAKRRIEERGNGGERGTEERGEPEVHR